MKTVREAVQQNFAERVLITARLSNDLKQAHILKMQEEKEEKRKGLRKIIKLLKLKLLLKEKKYETEAGSGRIEKRRFSLPSP